MRVLVTGAAGYLGRAVVGELRRGGHHVAAFVHRAPFPDAAGIELHHGDLLDEDAVMAAVRGADAVVHLAGLGQVRESVEQPARFYRVNVGGTATVLDALTSASATTGRTARFMFASTATVYGAPTAQPITEDAPTDPRNPYAATKLAAEELLTWAAGAGHVAASTLRIFNAAGAAEGQSGQDEACLVPRVLAAARGREPAVEVFGDGSAVRDYVHVADVGRAFARVLEAAEPGPHRVFNVGATPASVSDIIETASRVTGASVPVVHRSPRAGESPELRGDTSRLRALGWRPQRSSLEQILRDQLSAAA